MYGGPRSEEARMRRYTGKYFEKWWRIPSTEKRWKWLHSDLAVRAWYKAVGRGVVFDVLHLIEWDLVLFQSIEKAYRHIGANSIGLTDLHPLRESAHRWYWTTHEPYKSQWARLLSLAQKKYNYHGQPQASVGPGMTFPKAFLARYAREKIPVLAHDELRVPLYGKIFGFNLSNTRLGYLGKKDESRYFNCNGILITLSTITSELTKKNGRRAFHPYRGFVPQKLIRAA
jgi:hypothetical protein